MSVGADGDQVFDSKEATAVSWLQMRPALSPRLIEQSASSLAVSIIDFGGSGGRTSG